MATLIPFRELKTGETYFEQFISGTDCITCKVLNRIDDTHVHMRYGVVCPWTMDTREDAQFRYWDAMPSEEQKQAAWE